MYVCFCVCVCVSVCVCVYVCVCVCVLVWSPLSCTNFWASFSNPYIASPTSQLVLQPFCCFTYVTWRAAHGMGARHWWAHSVLLYYRKKRGEKNEIYFGTFSRKWRKDAGVGVAVTRPMEEVDVEGGEIVYLRVCTRAGSHTVRERDRYTQHKMDMVFNYLPDVFSYQSTRHFNYENNWINDTTNRGTVPSQAETV